MLFVKTKITYKIHLFQACQGIKIFFFTISYFYQKSFNHYNSSPEGANFTTLTSSWATVWVKMASSWACFVLFGWTLLAPMLFPDREFF